MGDANDAPAGLAAAATMLCSLSSTILDGITPITLAAGICACQNWSLNIAAYA